MGYAVDESSAWPTCEKRRAHRPCHMYFSDGEYKHKRGVGPVPLARVYTVVTWTIELIIFGHTTLGLNKFCF